jgi:hypothetical protein
VLFRSDRVVGGLHVGDVRREVEGVVEAHVLNLGEGGGEGRGGVEGVE